MKYALVHGQREDAQPELSGECPGCGRPVVAKCGEIKMWHWAHLGKRICDPWWENETEWHRNWKGHFPKEWQEFVHHAENGEKHIADVKTDQGYVVEFQHSHIKPEERQARENFYKKMIWIVDGTRRSRDKGKFFDGVMFAPSIDGRDDLRESPGDGPLLNDWGRRNVLVFFDFGEDTLWGLLPDTPEGIKYGFRVERQTLIESLLADSQSNQSFDRLLRSYTGKIEAHEWRLKIMKERAQRDPLMMMSFSGRSGYSRRRY